MAQAIQDRSVRRLMRDDLRIPIEQCVYSYLGRAWQVTRAEDKTDAASHPAAILADETYAVERLTQVVYRDEEMLRVLQQNAQAASAEVRAATSKALQQIAAPSLR